MWEGLAGNVTRVVPQMGNKASGGPFAPLVVAVRNVMGKKEFNKFRGQAISLHSQSMDPLKHDVQITSCFRPLSNLGSPSQ